MSSVLGHRLPFSPNLLLRSLLVEAWVVRVRPPLFLVGGVTVRWVVWRMYFYLGLVGDGESNYNFF